jgi:TolB-like protein/class 3 adenylate cyclase
MEDRLPRKLVAILYADVAGYSRLTGEDEDATHRALSDYLDLIASTIETHRGQVMHYAGDAVLARFEAVVDAVSCAAEIQTQLAERNAVLPDERKVRFRIGVNLGDVIEDRGDIYGDGVNVAARLESLAKPGGICISDSVRTAVGKKLELGYEDMGEQQVKNIDEPVRAYRVVMTAVAQAASTESAEPELKLPDKPSIAVLPFTNMSGDVEQEYFCDGITEDIITSLSQVPSLFVIARNSSFAYKGAAVDIKAVSRELGVRYMLEGSVRRRGSQLRVTAQLLDSHSAAHVWAERYDGNVEDVFKFQDEITRNIVGGIAPQIELEELKRARVLHSSNLTAYELSLKAQAISHDAIRAGDFAAVLHSIEVAREALEIDDREVRALWTQAFGYVYQYLQRWGDNPDAALDSVRELAERLIQADSSYPFGYLARAFTHQFEGRFDEAVADYHRALDLNSNLATILSMAAWGESLAGLTKEATEHAELALRLSPKDLDMWLGESYLALLQAKFAEQDFDTAEKWGRLAVQMHTTAPIRRSLMIAICTYKGDLQGATTHAEALDSFAPAFVPAVLRGEIRLYKNAEHNELLAEGLRKFQLTS